MLFYDILEACVYCFAIGYPAGVVFGWNDNNWRAWTLAILCYPLVFLTINATTLLHTHALQTIELPARIAAGEEVSRSDCDDPNLNIYGFLMSIILVPIVATLALIVRATCHLACKAFRSCLPPAASATPARHLP